MTLVNKVKLRTIHPFPARMAPSIVWRELSKTKKPLRILDPMAGSGTSLVVARVRGHKPVGFDTDPLAALIAEVWCADAEVEKVKAVAARIVARAKRGWRKIPLAKAYPSQADAETQKFVRYWFDKTNRRQLAALAQAISRSHDKRIKLILWCAFSKLIITKQGGASLAMDVSHSRPHKVYVVAPIRPVERFEKAVHGILDALPFHAKGRPRLRRVIRKGDARRLPLREESIDLVITSPPYLNAIDYLRGHKLSLVWMGYKISGIRMLRATNVGAEVRGALREDDDSFQKAVNSMGRVDRLPKRLRGVLLKYAQDMNAVLKEISRVLIPRGRAILVVGDSTLRGIYVRNSRAIANLARMAGLNLESRKSRRLPDNRRYLPPPRSMESGKSLQARMRNELVLCFRKCA